MVSFIIRNRLERIFRFAFIGKMENNLVLEAAKRKVIGKKVKKLRREGILPASLYGRGVKSQALQVEYPAFEKVLKTAGETQIVSLKLDGEEKPVLIHNIQKDPLTDRPIHIDFLQVNLKQKITTSVPVVGVNESPAEKEGLGTVVFYLDEVEVEALPTDLPEKIEVDLSNLAEVDQTVLVKDLKVERDKVTLKENPEEVVLKVEAAKEEPVVEETPAAEAAPEAGAEAGEEKEGAEAPQSTEEAGEENKKE